MDNCCDGDKAGKNFSAVEIEQVAQLKRFSEWLQADGELRKRLYKDERFTAEQEAWLKKIGVDLDVNDMAFFWKYPLGMSNYLMLVVKGQE